MLTETPLPVSLLVWAGLLVAASALVLAYNYFREEEGED